MAASAFDRAAHLQVGLAAAQGFALVAVGFALTVRDLHLDQSFFQVELQRDDGAALLAEPLGELQNLVVVQQQPPLLGRDVVEAVAEAVDRDMNIEQPCLAVVDGHITLVHHDRAVATAFHLGSDQFDAGFETFDDMIVVKRLFIGGEYRIRRSLSRHDSPRIMTAPDLPA